MAKALRLPAPRNFLNETPGALQPLIVGSHIAYHYLVQGDDARSTTSKFTQVIFQNIKNCCCFGHIRSLQVGSCINTQLWACESVLQYALEFLPIFAAAKG